MNRASVVDEGDAGTGLRDFASGDRGTGRPQVMLAEFHPVGPLPEY